MVFHYVDEWKSCLFLSHLLIILILFHVQLDNLAYLRRVVATWHTREGLARLSDYTYTCCFNLVYHKSVCKLILFIVLNFLVCPILSWFSLASQRSLLPVISSQHSTPSWCSTFLLLRNFLIISWKHQQHDSDGVNFTSHPPGHPYSGPDVSEDWRAARRSGAPDCILTMGHCVSYLLSH